MKTKLLLAFLTITLVSYSQSPINEFTSAAFSVYTEATSSVPLDQSATGSTSWTFNTLSATSNTNSDSVVAPTAGELATYPGTTDVLTITSSPSGNESKIFIEDASTIISLTGLNQGDIILNYNVDNALIGDFPLNFSDPSTTDDIEGTYEYPDSPIAITSRTFVGTIVSNVDAYGTLNTNDIGDGPFSGSVTRLKTVQNITISGIVLGFIPISGTAVITTHNYYKSDGDLVFRTIETDIEVPDAGIDENDIIIESLIDSILDVEEQNSISDDINISPNPVENELNINLLNNQVIRSVQVFDIQGREVLNSQGNTTTITVDKLNTGIYYASIITENGKVTQKFIKK
jgi:hypothetical protein